MKGAAVLTILFLAESASAWVFSANLCSSALPKLEVIYGGVSKACDAILVPADVASPPAVRYTSAAAGYYLLLITDLDDDDNVYAVSTEIMKKPLALSSPLALDQAVVGYQQPTYPAGTHYQQYRLYKWNSDKKRPNVTLSSEADFDVKKFEMYNKYGIVSREAVFQLKVDYPEKR